VRTCTIVFKTTLSEMYSTTWRLDATDFHNFLCIVVSAMDFHLAYLGSVSACTRVSHWVFSQKFSSASDKVSLPAQTMSVSVGRIFESVCLSVRLSAA